MSYICVIPVLKTYRADFAATDLHELVKESEVDS